MIFWEGTEQFVVLGSTVGVQQVDGTVTGPERPRKHRQGMEFVNKLQKAHS